MHKIFGLIGYPLKNNFSQNYFTQKFKTLELPYQYKNFEISNIHDIEKLLLHNPGIYGLNVTKPYKKSIMPFLNMIDETAKQVGAVNCIVVDNKSLMGYNTDVVGFKNSFLPWVEPILHQHTNVLILGNGGAAKAVEYVLNELNFSYKTASRNTDFDFSCIDKETILSHQIIINCTPIGMYPDVNSCPKIPYQFLTPEHYCYDLIYLPEETLFLKKAKKQKAKIKNGLEMLYLQADAAWDLWNNERY